MENIEEQELTEVIESISAIFRDEYKRVYECRDDDELQSSHDNLRQAEAAIEISKKFVALIKGSKNWSFAFTLDQELLFRVIRRAEFNTYYAHKTFENIELLFQGMREAVGDDSIPSTSIDLALDALEVVAIRFFEEYLVEEFEGVHIAEIVQRTKSTLHTFESSRMKFFCNAVERTKEDAERRIEWRIEEKRNRELMYEPSAERAEAITFDDQLSQGGREQRQRDRGLTRESAYLFVDYLLNHIYKDAVNAANIKARAEAVEFLTGYSSTKLREVPNWFSKEKALIAENMETSEKISSELQKVRKMFETLGLQDIVTKIDEDLGENL